MPAAGPARSRGTAASSRSVRGSVVDVRFDGPLPAIHSVLHAGADGAIVIEVLTQLDPRHVRGVALTSTEGLARGMPVPDTGAPLQAPVGRAILSRMFDVFGRTIDGGRAAGGRRRGARCTGRRRRWRGARRRRKCSRPASR